MVQAKLVLRFFLKDNQLACFEVPIYSEGYDEKDAVSKLPEVVKSV